MNLLYVVVFFAFPLSFHFHVQSYCMSMLVRVRQWITIEGHSIRKNSYPFNYYYYIILFNSTHVNISVNFCKFNLITEMIAKVKLSKNILGFNFRDIYIISLFIISVVLVQ